MHLSREIYSALEVYLYYGRMVWHCLLCSGRNVRLCVSVIYTFLLNFLVKRVNIYFILGKENGLILM